MSQKFNPAKDITVGEVEKSRTGQYIVKMSFTKRDGRHTVIVSSYSEDSLKVAIEKVLARLG